MQRLRILVVEDEAMLRGIMVEGLSSAGFDVDEAGDSDTAVKLLDADGYSLLLTDVHMPGKLNGLQLAERTHRHEAALPIVIATAQPDAMTGFDNTQICAAVLIKPFRLSRLLSIVQKLTDLGRTENDAALARNLALLPEAHLA